VHGLGGSDATWGEFPSLIRKDKSFDGIDVDTFTYETSLLEFSAVGGVVSKGIAQLFPQTLLSWVSKLLPTVLPKLPKIQKVSDLLKGKITLHYNDYDEIYLIAHSMGGLVARQYLNDMILSKDETLKVKKLMLYAVPNNGSALAKVSNIYNNTQIKQLDGSSDFINQLNQAISYVDLSGIDIRYVVGLKDIAVDENSAIGEHSNRKFSILLDKTHFDIVKPVDHNDDSYIALKKFLTTDDTALEIGDNRSATLPQTVEVTPFVKEVFEAIEHNRLVVCYSQDHNEIAKENELLKQYAQLKFKHHLYAMDVPSFEDREENYFQGLMTSAGLRCKIDAANAWKKSMKSILTSTDSQVLFFFSNITEGDEELNSKMARIIRSLKNDHNNFYAICIGREDLAYLVHGKQKLSPLNTATEIFFPINKVEIPMATVIQVLNELRDDRELMVECLADDWNENWSIWSQEKGINKLFWKNILVNNSGKYGWRNEAIRMVAKEIFKC